MLKKSLRENIFVKHTAITKTRVFSNNDIETRPRTVKIYTLCIVKTKSWRVRVQGREMDVSACRLGTSTGVSASCVRVCVCARVRVCVRTTRVCMCKRVGTHFEELPELFLLHQAFPIAFQ